MSLRDYFSNNKIFTGTEKPTQGKFGVGDIIVNIGPNSAEEPMWICVEAGTPGVWELCSGVNEEEIADIVQANALSAIDYTDGVDIQIDGGNIGNMNELQTTDKSSIVGAINELFQNANNGKELIANAIGEPLNAEDTFSAMSTDINSLLSSFKTNMMNSGVTVESGDKFKQLIEKIKGLTEGEGNKGIQYAEGSVAGYSSNTNIFSGYTIEANFGFTPTILFVQLANFYYNSSNKYSNILVSNISSLYNDNHGDMLWIESFDDTYFTLKTPTSSNITAKGNVTWYAIGVGEEDTTLRDSLASILQEEGVNVTEEDGMASLIGKVDEEFEDKNNEMENLKQDLIDILTNRGISVEEGLTSEELVNKIDEGTKFELKAGTTGTYLVTFVSSTVGTYSDGVDRTINGTINFDKNKFRITGVSISYSTECEATTKCITSLVQYRNGDAIKTHFSVDGKNTNDFGSWSGTVTDVQHGDVFKFVSRHQQVSTTSSAWIRHTLKITCVINI